MTLPANIRVNLSAPFPAFVRGGSGIGVTKTNGVWTISLISEQMVSILEAAGFLPSYSGQTLLNFGTYPGATDASIVITGQTGIVAGSNVTAFLIATATADHSADEHWLDGPIITAGNIVAGVGFTIYGVARQTLSLDGTASQAYGNWTVGWRWQ